jgi:hypothetical protein
MCLFNFCVGLSYTLVAEGGDALVFALFLDHCES